VLPLLNDTVQASDLMYKIALQNTIMRNKTQLLLLLIFVIGCNQQKSIPENKVSSSGEHSLKYKSETKPSINDDSIMHYFIQVAAKPVEVPEDGNPYISDLETVKNIARPPKPYMHQPKYSMEKLYGVWGGKDAPVADFNISKAYIDVGDYEGDSRMPYIVDKDELIIFYNDFIRKGKIKFLSNDSLLISWPSGEQGYVRWKD
jgi:hypothetical protein